MTRETYGELPPDSGITATMERIPEVREHFKRQYTEMLADTKHLVAILQGTIQGLGDSNGAWVQGLKQELARQEERIRMLESKLRQIGPIKETGGIKSN